MGTFNFCLIIFQKIFLSNRFADEKKKLYLQMTTVTYLLFLCLADK